jgi:hypothetical protein
MAKKKKAGAGLKLVPKKDDPGILFESWFNNSADSEQQKIVADVEKHLKEIQTEKKNTQKNMRKEFQPLRIGMQLSKVRKAITGEDGPADPQTKEGRIWGDYRDSHLKDAGYSKASCDRYVTMTEQARKILPDSLIAVLLDYTDENGMVKLIGGSVEKPFGKFTKFLKSPDVQKHIKDGKVNGDLSDDDLLGAFNNPEESDTLDNISVAINTAVKRIFAKVKEEDKLKAPFDATVVVEKARHYVRDVIECLLLVCKCTDMTTFEAREDDGMIEKAGLDTLVGMVNKLNNEKKQKPVKKQRAKKGIPPKPEREQDIVMGDFTIRLNKKAQHFPQTPWEVFEKGADKPSFRAQDELQAKQEVLKLQAKRSLEKQSAANVQDLAEAAKQQAGAESDTSPAPPPHDPKTGKRIRSNPTAHS